MTRHRADLWLLPYQYLAGFSDASTGLLLVFAPQWTLTLMGVRHFPQPIAFGSFIGFFVFAVGAVYLLATRLPLDAANTPRWQTVWAVTALIRSSVAVFLLGEILAGRMEAGWLTVAIVDGALALVQWIGLSRGWLNFAA
jgi:hypothetical protein